MPYFFVVVNIRVRRCLFFSMVPQFYTAPSIIEFNSIENIMTFLVYRLPIVIPVVWLAVFASKRRSEAERLKQEYAHKEALAKSYQSFKMQIEKLDVEAKELLMEKLLSSAIDTISNNASTPSRVATEINITGIKLSRSGLIILLPLSRAPGTSILFTTIISDFFNKFLLLSFYAMTSYYIYIYIYIYIFQSLVMHCTGKTAGWLQDSSI